MKRDYFTCRIKPACIGIALSFVVVTSKASAEVAFHPSEKTSIALYGVLDVAKAYANNQRGRSNIYISQGSLTANRVGVRGSAELGADTQALFRLESGFDAITGKFGTPGYLFNRQAFVGVSNKSYGTLSAGRQYTPYFQYTGALGLAPALTAATGAHPGDVDAMDATLRLNNSLTYTLPKLGGWQAGVQYGMDGSTGRFSRGTTLSAAVRYDYQAFSWSTGYIGLNHIQESRAIATYANNAPINKGYNSADNSRILATAARYTDGKGMVGLSYSNVQYRPAAATSLFRETAVFNTVGLISTYAITPSFTLAGGYSYTAEVARNGVRTPALYHQFSTGQLYTLSKYVAFYAVQGYQHAGGKTLGMMSGVTAIVDAVASVGDSQNGTPSSTRHQFVAMLGVRFTF
ncbi:porin [Dyella sp. M7H15-1]|uniref:porin n=1 Tax=Dyella sp. M7H15-1 TaxID=2501295 RepID=UPI00100516BE|nr:porin [Dyella sp. M7H15-1]QAU23239.1 porin [Dyella sp. M7H15-1]